MTRTRAQIIRDLRGDGLEGASAPSSDPNDPRHRRNAQAATHALQRHNPDQFNVVDKVLNLNTRRPLDTRIREVDIFLRNNTGGGTIPQVQQEGFFHGAQFLLSQSDIARGGMFIIPDDMDRERDATLHVRWFRRNGASGGTTVSWDVDVLAWELEGVINPSATLALQIVNAALPAANGEAGTTLNLNAATLFGPSVVALKMNVARVASSDDSADSTAEAAVLHFFAVEYHVKHDHKHERTE
jgi:hypothetical protein